MIDAIDAFDALHGVMSQIKWRGFGNRNINLVYGRRSMVSGHYFTDVSLWFLVEGL